MNWIQKAINATGKSLVNFTTKGQGFTVINSINGHLNFSQFSDKKSVHDSYLANDDVYSMISTGAQTMANNIPWEVFNVKPNGESEQVFNTDLNRILLEPNKYQSQVEWREQAYIFLMLTGKSFIAGLESVGFSEFSSLHNLPSQSTSFKFGDLSQPIIKYMVDWEHQKEFAPENVLFTKYVTVDEKDYFNGLSPLRPGHRLLESSNDLVTADAVTLKNRGVSGLLTNRSDLVMTEDEQKKLTNATKSKLGGADKFNSVYPTNANVDYLALGLNPKDLEILKSDISKRRRFANVWGFDSSLFNDPANKTFNNRKEATKAAYENVYIPNDNKLVQGLNKWLAPKFSGPGENLVIIPNHNNIDALQTDQKIISDIKNKVSQETRAIFLEYNKGNVTREGAIIMLSNIGHTEADAEIIIQTAPNKPE